MTTTTEAPPNPYVGPRSFQTGEKLYGREREVRDLLGLLIAERIVLLHSPSGAGKTSLVQAALIPELQEHDFQVLPVMRVSLEPAPLAADDRRASVGGNRYILSLLLSLEEGLPPEQQTALADLAGMSLAEYLDRRPTNGSGDGEVLIFDQFEEILTVDPTDRAAKTAFFTQVGAALRKRHRWALFSMREDYVAALAPYVRAIPTRLDNTYQLDLLGADGARQAIQQPARDHGVAFDDAAARQLIDDLRRVYVQRSDGSMEEQLGPSVEPVQLQVVCYRLWDKRFGDASPPHDDGHLADGASGQNGGPPEDHVEAPAHAPPGPWQITTADLQAVGDVNSALSDYYAERVATIAGATGTSERAIREWFDRELITPQGIRGQVLQGEGRSQGLDNQTIRALIDVYLVRAEKRRGATWFELAHDRLIAPVRDNNAAWRETHLTQLQRQADLWNSQSRPDGLLLRDAALDEAERWAGAHAAALTPVESDFLEQCRKVREIVRRARRNNRVIRGLLVIALVLAGIAAIFFSQAKASADHAEQQRQLAEQQRQIADQQRQIAVQNEQRAREQEQAAQQQRQRAEQQTRVATAHGLAAAAVANLGVDPELSVLLARQAVLATRDAGEPPESDAVDALQQAVQTSRVRRTLPFTTTVWSVAYNDNGKLLATGGADGTIAISDAANGRRVATIASGTPGVYTVAWSPDGRLLASAAEGEQDTAAVWEAATGKLAFKLPLTGATLGVAWSPDGKRLATAGADGIVRIWDAASRRMVRELGGNEDKVNAVAFSHDGTRVASAGLDYTARVWNVASGQTSVLTHTSAVYGVAWSPDDALLATGDQNGVAHIWNIESRTEQSQFQGHTNTIAQLAFSPDGRTLASGSSDQTVRIWSLAANRLLTVLAGHASVVNSLAFSPDGWHIASASSDQTVRIWSLALEHTDKALALAFDPRGGALASAGVDRAIRVWDLAGERPIRTIGAHDEDITGVAFSPDGAKLFSSSYDTNVLAWNTGDWSETDTLTHGAGLEGLAVSSDGKHLATAGDDNLVTLWDLASGSSISLAHDNTVNAVAFSPDGRQLASVGVDQTARLWDVASGKPVWVFTDTEQLGAVAWSRDGARLAIGGDSGVIHVLSAASGAEQQSFAQSGAVKALAFNPANDQLAVATADRSVRALDANGRELFTLTHPADVYALAWSRDGARLATASADGAVRIFPTDVGALLGLAQQRLTRGMTKVECARYHLEDRCPQIAAP